MSKLARALYGFPPGSIVTQQMLADRKACLDADPLYSDEALRSLRSIDTSVEEGERCNTSIEEGEQ